MSFLQRMMKHGAQWQPVLIPRRMPFDLRDADPLRRGALKKGGGEDPPPNADDALQVLQVVRVVVTEGS